MQEIGGYIELDKSNGFMLHDNGLKLNCGRNAFAYIIKAKGIKSILMPKFMCDTCEKILNDKNVSIRYYSIGADFKCIIKERKNEEWLFVTNYYGQLTKDYVLSLGDKVILDNTQAYFAEPINDIDTFYSCRKYFGVADGAILYTNAKLDIDERDESCQRMEYLLGRFERSASEYYQSYRNNEYIFDNEPIKKMSKLTENMLRVLDYDRIRSIRESNFSYLNDNFCGINKLTVCNCTGPFMYPLYLDNGNQIREKLIERKIYIPILWPSVLEKCNLQDLEYDMANNIVPLPVDQRYSTEEMKYIVGVVNEVLKGRT